MREARPPRGQRGPTRGTGTWVRHADWPPTDARAERWFLSSGGGAASGLADGTLSRAPPAKFDPHPGTTEPWRATAGEVRSAEQSVFHELDRESALALPVRQ